MKNLCGMCVYYRGCCSNNQTVCIDGSEYIDKRTSITANVAIDNVDNSVHIVINGDMIKDIESFGNDLFKNVQTFIQNAMQRGLYINANQ